MRLELEWVLLGAAGGALLVALAVLATVVGDRYRRK